LHIGRARIGAFSARPAQLPTGREAGFADLLELAVATQGNRTVIKASAKSPCLFMGGMAADFLGDSGAVFAQKCNNPLKGGSFSEFHFNSCSAFKIHMFIFIHDDVLQNCRVGGNHIFHIDKYN